MFSVVIPLYNKEKYIAKALQSVLQQTFIDFELLVINDGSTDNSLSVINNFTDDRIKIISIENSGVSVARNTGIKAAKYRWIGFLDADDWWAPDFLSEMKFAIQCNSDKRMFASGRTLVFENEFRRYSHRLLPSDGETGICNYYEVITKYLPVINASNAVIKKSLFDEKGYFRAGQKQHEDHDLWIRLANKEDIVFINKPLSFYRKADSASVSKSPYAATDFCIYLKTLLDIKSTLSHDDRARLQQYTENFVFLTYLKHNWHYSNIDRQEVYSLVEQILSGKRRRLLGYVNAMPFNVYPILKMFKR